MNRLSLLLLLTALLAILPFGASAQGTAKVSPDQQVFNFGTIAEEKGLATHDFVITNTGNVPLVITRVTASCGCTRPVWEKEPIEPGKSGVIQVTYNPKGRPGPFYKTITIFSNGEKKRFNLAIKGNVTPRPKEPVFQYLYAIGNVKLHTLNVVYDQIAQGETQGKKIHLKNTGPTSARISFGKIPHFLTIDTHPDTLAPGKTGEITCLLNTSAMRHKGRKSAYLPIVVEAPGQEAQHGVIHFAANVTDNFSQWNEEARRNAPEGRLSGSLLDFGTFPEGKKKITGEVSLTNSGKSPLRIYSVSCDQEAVRISGGKKTIKPGQTVVYKITIKNKHLGDTLNTLVTWVCNDPNNPVLRMKVTGKR